MATLDLPGRILFLCQDPALVQAQLTGRRLTRAEAGALRDDISTDEITPVPILTHYDDTLGRYPYTGFLTGGQRPIRSHHVARIRSRRFDQSAGVLTGVPSSNSSGDR